MGIKINLTHRDMKDLTHAEVVQKWMFYCYNFGATNLVINGQGTTLPDCFNALKDDHMLEHLVDKYHSACQRYKGGTLGLINFYFDLNPERRADIVNWVMINYKGK